MILLRRSLLLTLSVLLALFIAACGSTPTTSTNSSASNTTTQTDKAADIQNNQAANSQQVVAATGTAQMQGSMQNTTQKTTAKTAQAQDNAQNNDQMPGNAANMQQGNQMNGNGQNAGTSTKTLVSTKQVNLNGQMVTVLTTFDGLTLYTYNADIAANSSCTGACAKAWPPLLSNGSVVSIASISGNLTVRTTANGPQVAYNGHLLYTYAGDMGAGQINGQGIDSMWQVAAVKLQKQHW